MMLGITLKFEAFYTFDLCINEVSMDKVAQQNQRIANMHFSTVYPLYLTKVVRKGRTQEELNQVISWLTGFETTKIEALITENVTFETFFRQATLHPNATFIKGLICGYRVEDITHPLTQKVRYLDKLVDELAKGKSMDKILRKK